jgi:hypothetical protein
MIGLTLETRPAERRNDRLAVRETLEIAETNTAAHAPATPRQSVSEASTANQENKSVEPLWDDIEDKLFNNSAEAKIDFSNYARHLSNAWRNAIFEDIDRLLSPEDWDEESAFIDKASFRTFLRFLTHTPPAAMPVLGLNHDGTVLGAWIKHNCKLTVSFLRKDQAKAILMLPTDEILAWQGNVASLYDFVIRNHASPCLSA